MWGWTTWAIALAIAGLAMGEAAPALAADGTTVAVQRLGPPEIEARREALLRQMLSRPSDLDLAFEYANALLASRRLRGRDLDARAHADLRAQHAAAAARAWHSLLSPRRLRGCPLLFRAGACQSERAAERRRADPPLSPAARARRRPSGLLRHDLLGHPLGEQRQFGSGHAERDPERLRLHPRPERGRPRRAGARSISARSITASS